MTESISVHRRLVRKGYHFPEQNTAEPTFLDSTTRNEEDALSGRPSQTRSYSNGIVIRWPCHAYEWFSNHSVQAVAISSTNPASRRKKRRPPCTRRSARTLVAQRVFIFVSFVEFFFVFFWRDAAFAPAPPFSPAPPCQCQCQCQCCRRRPFQGLRVGRQTVQWRRQRWPWRRAEPDTRR